MSRWRTMDERGNEDLHFNRIFLDLGVAFLLLLLGSMYGCPKYGVWQQGLKGEAELRRAEQNRRITVQEAEAKRDAASALAQAEIERAKGVDSANKIIGSGLKGHEEYLRYLWIMSLEHVAIAEGSTVVYVPTEAGLPVLEAARLAPKLVPTQP